MAKRSLYHSHGCKFIEIDRNSLKECPFCHGSGFIGRMQTKCNTCNGHGELWVNSGYGFKKYTLESVYV